MKKLSLIRKKMSKKLEIDKIEENEHEINNILDGNEIFLEPRVGMMFNSEKEVKAYYT